MTIKIKYHKVFLFKQTETFQRIMHSQNMKYFESIFRKQDCHKENFIHEK